MNQPRRTPPPCPLCQGLRVWADIGTGDGNTLSLTYGHKPTRFIRIPMFTGAAAAICLNCGFTAFYAENVPQMREEIQQHPEWFDR